MDWMNESKRIKQEDLLPLYTWIAYIGIIMNTAYRAGATAEIGALKVGTPRTCMIIGFRSLRIGAAPLRTWARKLCLLFLIGRLYKASLKNVDSNTYLSLS